MNLREDIQTLSGIPLTESRYEEKTRIIYNTMNIKDYHKEIDKHNKWIEKYEVRLNKLLDNKWGIK